MDPNTEEYLAEHANLNADEEAGFIKYAVLCRDRCHRIYIIEVPAARYGLDEINCPVCGGAVEEIDEANYQLYQTCVEAPCSQYLSSAAASDSRGRCEGTREDKHGPCNAELEPLSQDLIDELPPDNVEADTDTNDPAEVRRLKSMMGKVQRWISGSGAHHRSKGGSHTAAATQTHSSAHQAKKRIRDAYSAELNLLADQVNAKTYSKLVGEARGLANAVLAK